MLAGMITFMALVGPSFQYKMDTVTRDPLVLPPTPINESRMALLEFELERSPTLQTVEGRLGIEDAEDLCNHANKDSDFRYDQRGKRIFHYVPVSPVKGYSMPVFVRGCFGWVRKRCAGIPRPPLDYRCHYWVPYYFLSDASCYYADKAGRVPPNLRKKRMANMFEPIVVDGLEVATLCATIGQLPADKLFEFDTVVLPTNEATQLRCIKWRLSMDGGWAKEKLDRQACELMNHHRPSDHVQSERYQGAITDMLADIIKCEGIEKIVKCRFLKHNVREPSLNL